MTGSQTFERLDEKTLEEHRQIHFYLDQVLRALETLAADPEDVEPMRRLAAQLEGLGERLAEHCQIEEQGGLYSAILEVLPEARQDLQALKIQHGRMVDVIEMGRIHAQFGQPSEAADLRVDLEGFVEMIRTHALAEEAILEQAIEREIAEDL